jgi:protease-4
MRAKPEIQTLAHVVRARAQSVLARLPGERPKWVVVELSGLVTPRIEKQKLFGLPLPPRQVPGTRPLPALLEALDALGRAPWLEGVLFRVEGLRADPATAYALRRAMAALGEKKKTVAYLSSLDWTAYYVASAAREIAAPESADVGLRGLGLSITFMRDALARVGVRFEKLAIDEYKNAFDTLVRQEMSPAQREQLEALLARFEAHFTAAIGERRGLGPEKVRALVDEGLTSAEQAKAAGLLDRVAYEDEIVGERWKPIGEAHRFLAPRVPAVAGGRVAVVSLVGNIMPGKSKRVPFGGGMAGSETLVRALRTASQDESTRAVVFFVDSGGGSALASDLIAREVKLLREKKPVVGVMGAVAASGGYYVLTHANRIIAAPTTITGSIGVLTGKLVIEDLLSRWGFHAEHVRRGRFALMLDPSRGLADDERALLARGNEETYERFLARVAEGRGMSRDQVHEVARGRVWAGEDARRVGLVDELGDVETGIARARELAGLGPAAPVWDVSAPDEHVLPDAMSAAALMDLAAPILRETRWLVLPASFKVV